MARTGERFVEITGKEGLFILDLYVCSGFGYSGKVSPGTWFGELVSESFIRHVQRTALKRDIYDEDLL